MPAGRIMPYRLRHFLQETGLEAGAQGTRGLLLDSAAVKAGGTGALVLIGALIDMATSVLAAGVFSAWSCWMVLGLVAAKIGGERFEVDKVIGGVWKLAGAAALLTLFVTVEEVAAERGADWWWVSLAGGGYLFVAFVWKAIQKGNEVFPGLEAWARKAIPDTLDKGGGREDRED